MYEIFQELGGLDRKMMGRKMTTGLRVDLLQLTFLAVQKFGITLVSSLLLLLIFHKLSVVAPVERRLSKETVMSTTKPSGIVTMPGWLNGTSADSGGSE
jgi:hypothetical protein